ncbi:hypothetical protein ACEPPN_003177 [Leptodophora sp. 'Broadleaf-Isolate-01']
MNNANNQYQSASPATSSSPDRDVNPAATMQPRVFELFPNFPLEIRLLVWKATSSEPRLLDIWYSEVGLDRWTNAFRGQEKPHYYYTHANIPSVLHVSREARNVGLQHYRLDFGTEVQTGVEIAHGTRSSRGAKVVFSTPARIYVNWECDIICLSFDPERDLQNMVLGENRILQEFTGRFSRLQRFALELGQVGPFHLATFSFYFEWLLNLCSHTKGMPPRPLEDITIYCYLPLPNTSPFEADDVPLEAEEVSLELVRFSGIDEDHPQQLHNTVRLDRLDRLREARDTVLQAIKHIAHLRAEQKREFEPPTVSIAFMNVTSLES